jgi:hyperosmotically inducible protein
MEMNRARQIGATLCASLLLALAGCNNDTTTKDTNRGPAASAGQKIDQASTELTEKAGDAAITAKVKAALIKEPGIKSASIGVDTTGGKVTLSGTVDTAENKTRAAEIAHEVAGVKSVENRLTVGATG